MVKMRQAILLPLAVAAAMAFVIPDEETAKTLAIKVEGEAENTLSSWWDRVPSLDDVSAFAEDKLDDAREAFDHQAGRLEDILPDAVFGSEITDFLGPLGGKGGHDGHHSAANLTVYQAIHASDYTSKFAALVDEYPELVKTLNSAEANATLFVPINKAFEKIPDHHHEKPPKEWVEELVQYHVVPGAYPAGRTLAHHTLPTLLHESELGDNPQRIRISVGLFGVHLNFYSKVVALNIWAKNGVIHGLDSILVPPPPAGKLIQLAPAKFSTLLLAAEKAGLEGHAGEHPDLTGLTIFAPTNRAFEKLGPAANAFLFNTEKGARYLRALIFYHSVVNETLYSDAYYRKHSGHHDGDDGDDDDDEKTAGGRGKNGHYHVDLPTVLHGKHLSIDIARFHRLIRIRVNGQTTVSVQDGLARDGVIHVVDSILLPPRTPGRTAEAVAYEGGEIEVEELIERLDSIASDAEEWVGEL